VRGPAVKAAFDDSGAPTKAAEGFARSRGVSVDDLVRDTDGNLSEVGSDQRFLIDRRG